MFFLGLVVFFTSCNQRIELDEGDGMGTVSLSLSADLRNDEVVVKSSVENVDVNDFWVEIITSEDVRIFCQKYVDVPSEINVNSGEYTLVASHGDADGVGFDKPYYEAREPFTVGPQEIVSVEATAKLANVKVAVSFSDNLKNELSYQDCYALVRNNGKKLIFNKTETRAGYIPAGDLEFVLYVKINGVWKQYVHTPITFHPNDFVTFSVNAGGGEGKVTLKINIDDTMEEVVLDEVVVDSEDLPLGVEEPTISVTGFDQNGQITAVEGKVPEVKHLSLGAVASGEIGSAILRITSDELIALGAPASVDLMNADETTTALLESLGIWWQFDENNKKLAVSLVEAYNNVITKVGYKGYDSNTGTCIPIASFGLDIEAIYGATKTVSKDVYVIYYPDVDASISLEDYNVWATKVVNPKLTVTKGDPSKFKIQYSADGAVWSDINSSTVTGLNPSTKYRLRSVFDSWYVLDDVIEITTEAAAQVGNAGFEEWTTQTYEYKELVFINTYESVYQDWSQPFSSEAASWWAVNSKVSMPDEITSLTVNEIKCFPTCGFSTSAYKGSKSAYIGVVNVGNANTAEVHSGTTYVGELFIGKSSVDGSHASDGHSFTSRPTSLSFYYWYYSKDGETFCVTAKVYASDGTEIASSEITNGQSSNDAWKEYTLPLEYSVSNKKAAKIYISFKSSNKGGNASVSSKAEREVDGKTVKAHFGSFLKVDEIKLNY